MGFSAKKAAKSIDKALAGLDSQIKAGNAARAAQADADMADIRKDMAAKTAARVASNSAPKKQSFAEAFRAARKDKGAGSTFTWQGKSYSTNMAGEGKAPSRPAARPAAKSDKAAPAPRPMNKPTTAMPAKSNLEDIKAKGAALRASFSGPAPKPQPRPNDFSAPRRASFSEVVTRDNRGAPIKQTPEQRRKLEEAVARSGTRSSFAKGGSVDGCAVRGKTRAPLRKK